MLGQLLPSSASERKTLLAAGSRGWHGGHVWRSFSALLLAVELLLFEFRPRSLIPVALAVGTASIVRSAWIGSAPVFPMPEIAAPSPGAFFACLGIAVVFGVAAFAISRSVYLIEDTFEKLPFHWMWWPALGGVAVRIVGYFEPGPSASATTISRQTWPAQPRLAPSWLSALSNTSRGALLGWHLGWDAGSSYDHWQQARLGNRRLRGQLHSVAGSSSGGSAPAWHCVFGGAAQAILAAPVFAFETTSPGAALAPLMACCAVAVWVVRLLSSTSIMTEKIERRGVSVPLPVQRRCLRAYSGIDGDGYLACHTLDIDTPFEGLGTQNCRACDPRAGPASSTSRPG